MAVRAIVNLGFVAHTGRDSSANPNIRSFREHKEVAQRPKLENWQSHGPQAKPRVFLRFRTGGAPLS
jgi:hypothetical protein